MSASSCALVTAWSAFVPASIVALARVLPSANREISSLLLITLGPPFPSSTFALVPVIP